jgi:hypothetical protein
VRHQPVKQEVTFAWEFLEARRTELGRLTGDWFQPEMTCFWRAGCYEILGSLRRGEQRAIRQQLAHHLDAAAHYLKQGHPSQALAWLPTIQVTSGRGKFRGRTSARLPALLPRLHALAPLLTTDDSWVALEMFWVRVLDQLLTRLPLGRQRAILDQLGIHLGWICDSIRRKKVSPTVIRHNLPNPILTSRRGQYTGLGTTPTYPVPDSWEPAAKVQLEQIEPDVVEVDFPFVAYPYFPTLCPDLTPDILALLDTKPRPRFVVKEGKKRRRIRLQGLADEYEQIMRILTPLLSSVIARQGWERIDDPYAQQIRTKLQQMFPAIPAGYWRGIMIQSKVPHPEEPGWWRLNREGLACETLGHLYHLNPASLNTTLLPQARRLRQPWADVRTWLVNHFTRKYPHEA